MADNEKALQRVLLIYYSFSGQTSVVLHHLAVGLESHGVKVVFERLHPQTPLRFPFGTVLRTVKMMFATFCRFRIPITPPSKACSEDYDLIILAGPTWSYNPSGPVLSLIDQYGKRLFARQQVLPMISCRRYWRTHYWGLRRILRTCGANVVNRVIFTHPSPEPWLTIGVFLKLAGMNPERFRLLRRFYKKYGHSREQLDEARQLGDRIGKALQSGHSLSRLSFPPI